MPRGPMKHRSPGQNQGRRPTYSTPELAAAARNAARIAADARNAGKPCLFSACTRPRSGRSDLCSTHATRRSYYGHAAAGPSQRKEGPVDEPAGGSEERLLVDQRRQAGDPARGAADEEVAGEAGQPLSEEPGALRAGRDAGQRGQPADHALGTAGGQDEDDPTVQRAGLRPFVVERFEGPVGHQEHTSSPSMSNSRTGRFSGTAQKRTPER